MIERPYSFDGLSPRGEARRGEILQLAIAAARRRRYRRRGGALLTLAVIFTGAVLAGIAMRHQERQPALMSSKPIPLPATREGVVVTYLESEPHISDRLAVKARLPAWKSISDDELLSILGSDERPVGLAYVNGREVLWNPNEPGDLKNQN